MAISHFRPFRRPRLEQDDIPGQIVVDEEREHPTTMRGLAYDAKSVEVFGSVTAENLEEFDTDPRRTWLDVVGLADSETLTALAERYDIHPLAMEDVVNTHQRPKVEAYDGNLFFILRMPRVEGGAFLTEQVSFFLRKNHLITIQERPGDCFDTVRDRIHGKRGRIRRQQADYLAYALIDVLVDDFYPVLESIGAELEDLEETLMEGPSRKAFNRVHRLRRELLQIRRTLWPLREMVTLLVRIEHNLMGDTARTYLNDVADHAAQLLDVTDTYRETCGDLRELHFSQVNQKDADVGKALTIVATFFLPMSFIAGLYGMNFDTGSPYNLPELGWRYGYPYALGLMLVTGIGILFWAWRKGWLKAD